METEGWLEDETKGLRVVGSGCRMPEPHSEQMRGFVNHHLAQEPTVLQFSRPPNISLNRGENNLRF